ncbi:MAG: OadG family protein [Anaerolineae bacterium]|nr:OadG family protein [Anaerolineae bacterium]
MTTLLNQALVLTLIGMGMTFGALGLLVLGMYAMTALITDRPRRKRTATEEPPPEEALVTQVADVVLHLAAAANLPNTEVEADEDRERAAAAAVALALALEDSAPHALADDRYRAAAAAVAMAVAAASAGATAVSAPASVITMPDPWSSHARGEQLTRRQRFART